MNKLCAAGVTAAFSVAMFGATAASVLAAPPANDAYADRIPVDLASPVAVDTTEATVEPLDLEATQACPLPPGPPPATTNTVWFDWHTGPTPPSTALVSFSGATFPAGVAVVTGDPGSFAGVACGLSAIFEPEPATIYHVLVFDPFDTGGGTATLTIDEPPPAPTLSLTVDRVGRFDPQTGAAMLSGTYRCTDAFFVDIFGDVRQHVGRFTVIGLFSSAGAECDGEEHAWTATVVPDNGAFAGGKAVTVAIGFSCGALQCTDAFVEQTVMLRGGQS
jgi:hypothetical protein